MNQITITGNVGREVEMRYTPQGVAVANVSIAVQKGYGDNKSTVWMKLTIWRERAETFAKYVKKGSRLLVTGEADVEVWTSKKGEASGQIVVTIDKWEFIGDKKDNNAAPGSTMEEEEFNQPESAADMPF